MNGPRGHHDQDAETYRMPAHHRVARVRHSWWGVVATSLLGVSGAIALIVVAGAGGATADVPSALQVGAQAAPSISVTTPSVVATTPTTPTKTTATTATTATTTTAVPTTTATITSPAGGPSAGAPTTHPSTTTTPARTSPSTTSTTTPTTTPTTVSAPVTIVIPKSKVTEGSGAAAGSDDGSKTATKVGDN